MKKNSINTNLKILIAFIFGIIISTTLSYTLAATLVNSKDVYYDKTSSGLAVNNVQAAIDGTCTKFSDQLTTLQTTIINKIYPIGSIYISYNSTNPSSLFGGTWENYGNGRVLRGINSGTAGQTGGADTVTLKEANLPAHTHDISHTHTTPQTGASHSLTAASAGAHTHGLSSGVHVLAFGAKGNGTYGWTKVSGSGAFNEYGKMVANILSAGAHTHSVTGSVTVPAMTTNSISTSTSGSTGSGTAFSTLDPYITVYMWRRTA